MNHYGAQQTNNLHLERGMAATFDIYAFDFLKQLLTFIPLFFHLIFISATFIACCGKKNGPSRKDYRPQPQQSATPACVPAAAAPTYVPAAAAPAPEPKPPLTPPAPTPSATPSADPHQTGGNNNNGDGGGGGTKEKSLTTDKPTKDDKDATKDTNDTKEKDDSFENHKPVIRDAKRADEIKKHGPVDQKRKDYKTLRYDIPSSDFDKSLGLPNLEEKEKEKQEAGK